MTRPIVFLGPSLPAAEAAALWPAAAIHGPVSVGEVLALARARRRPPALAIIDGYFERMAAVWHKEILVALAAGIAVYGAASMGALRAAELAPHGMIGSGAIYRAFARGALIADDEVAVAHLPADYGYRPVSDALVDLRAGIARAPRLSAATRAHLVELSRRRFYRDRTWTALDADARAAGVRTAIPRVGQKSRDARALLRRLSRGPIARPAALDVPRTWALTQLEKLT